jgi:hypothetical protein
MAVRWKGLAMRVRRLSKKSPIDDFGSMIMPDRMEEAFERVDEYFTIHHHLSFNSPDEVGGVLNELIHQHGETVRTALNALLCNPE